MERSGGTRVSCTSDGLWEVLELRACDGEGSGLGNKEGLSSWRTLYLIY